MPAILKALNGEEFVEIAELKDGQAMILGRNFDADIAVAGDPKISGNHLKMVIQGGQVQIEDLQSTNGTFVKDERVMQAQLALGDSFRCGGTQFVVVDESAAAMRTTMTEVDAVPISAPKVAATPAFSEPTAKSVVDRFQIADQLAQAPGDDESTADFAIRLANGEEPNHCVTFMAYALEKRTAVWWLTQCIEQVESILDDHDRLMLQLAEKWVQDPSDANRRQAMAHAEKLEMSTPSCWAGVGAFWSGGSMAPPDAPVVEPKDNLAGKAISGGAILASVFRKPEHAFEKQKSFIQIGVDIAEGRMPWEG